MSGYLQHLIREIRKCSGQKDIFKCRAIHEEVIRSEHSHDRYLGNLLIDMYGKAGSSGESKGVFDSMMLRNVFSWNMILAAYAQSGDLLQAAIVFQRFPEHDVVSWNSILQVFVRSGEINRANEIFIQMPERDMVSWNTFLQAEFDLEAIFARSPCHNVRSATVWISKLAENRQVDQAKLQFDSMPERDAVTWNAMIHAFADNGDPEAALKLFEKIPERTYFSWNVMLKVFAEQGRLKDCVSTFHSMPERSPVSWTTMMTTYAQNSHLDKCKQLFDSMPERNVIAWTILLDSCSQYGLLDQAQKVFFKMPYRDEIAFNSVLSAYAREGHIEQARDIYETMPTSSLSSLNSLIQVYAQTEHFTESEYFLRLGTLQGLNPNQKTFIGILAGYSYSGKLIEGAKCFGSLVSDFHLDPWIEHYCCIVHLLGRANRPEEAQELIDNMPFNASGVEWTSLLDSCRLHGDVSWARVAAEKAIDTQPEHGGFYPLLSDVHAHNQT